MSWKQYKIGLWLQWITNENRYPINLFSSDDLSDLEKLDARDPFVHTIYPRALLFGVVTHMGSGMFLAELHILNPMGMAQFCHIFFGRAHSLCSRATKFGVVAHVGGA